MVAWQILAQVFRALLLIRAYYKYKAGRAQVHLPFVMG